MTEGGDKSGRCLSTYTLAKGPERAQMHARGRRDFREDSQGIDCLAF